MRHLLDPSGQRLIRQSMRCASQPGLIIGKQRHRAGRLGSVMRQQCKGIKGIEPCRPGQQRSLAFFWTKVVEYHCTERVVPLSR